MRAVLTYLVLCLVFDAGFVAGCWWHSRHRPDAPVRRVRSARARCEMAEMAVWN